MEKNKHQGEGTIPAISRRQFIQAGSALAALPFVVKTGKVQAQGAAVSDTTPEEKVVQTCSTFDCGGKCDIRAHVSEGVVTRISTRPDNALDPQMPVMRACVRGRAYRKFVYHPDRLKYPMKRVGKRGEGKFERITWDEATTLIANQLKTITQKYGAASRYVHVGTAVSGGTFSGDKMVRRLLNLTGGYLEAITRSVWVTRRQQRRIPMAPLPAAVLLTRCWTPNWSSSGDITRRKRSLVTATTSTRR